MSRSRLLKILIALVALACFAWVGSGYLDEMYRITQAHWLGVLGIALVHVLTLWVQSLGIKFGLDAFDNPIGERESFSLFVVSSYANLLLPRSGVGTTAVYLNRVRNNSMIDYSSVVLYNAGLFVLACSGMALMVCGLDWWTSGLQPPLFLLAGLPLVFVASLVAMSIRWNKPKNYQGPGAGLWQRMAHASRRLVHSGNLYRMGLVHFVLVFLRALRLQIAFWAMHIDVGFFPVLLASVLGDLAFVIAVTPGALGFREAAITLVSVKLGTSISVALSVAIFDRLVFSLTVVLLAQFVLAFFVRRNESAGRTTEPAQTLTASPAPAPSAAAAPSEGH